MAKLLIADDDVELCTLLHTYLGAEGFDVHAVHDGLTALERATAEAFDLIILDVMMPGKDGLEVLKQLRKRQLTPVLMLTARGEDSRQHHRPRTRRRRLSGQTLQSTSAGRAYTRRAAACRSAD